ncbi:hypothetical protein CVT24_009359 [Panaeolus cyanescens]|uniref:SH3 domain-containing protein n=1 Tax=Panaeolus cyanescens TaxID=181874 RepID=A0A409Y844_9AGAR|nr:hypothetical protein CVT24_009359 [Panaeolus cyanescens]
MYVRHQRPGQQLQEQVQEYVLHDKRQTSDGLPGINGDRDGFSLTGPITITITRQTRLPLPTPTISSLTSLSLPASTSVQTNLPTSTASPLPPPSAPSTSPPVILSTTTGSSAPTTTSTSNETALPNAAATTTAVSGGVVAGIVISCVFLVGTVLFFVWRARSKKRRRRNRGIWSRSKALNMPAPVSNMDYGNEKGTYRFTSPTANEKISTSPTRQGPKRVPVPQLNPKEERPPSNAFDSGLTSPIISTFSSGTVLSVPYGSISQKLYAPPPPQMLSPFSAKVISTFIPNLPDELKIELDDIVRVLAEYDDGWALCMNTAGEQGMVPLECLDRGDSGVSVTRRSTLASQSSAPVSLAYLSMPEVPPLERRGSKRLSSLDPTSQPVKTYPTA